MDLGGGGVGGGLVSFSRKVFGQLSVFMRLEAGSTAEGRQQRPKSGRSSKIRRVGCIQMTTTRSAHGPSSLGSRYLPQALS